MEFLTGLFAGAFVGVMVMATMNFVSRREEYDRGMWDGYKRGVTELEPYVRDLQLREWAGRLDENKC